MQRCVLGQHTTTDLTSLGQLCAWQEKYMHKIQYLFILDQRKLEKVQRRATRLLPSISDKPTMTDYHHYNYHPYHTEDLGEI